MKDPDRRAVERLTAERRQRLLAVPAVDVSIPPMEDAPFLRPKHRMQVKRPRKSRFTRTLILLQAAGCAALLLSLVWSGYSRVMASERLKVSSVDVRGSHFLSQGEVRDLLGPAVGENILGVDIAVLKERLQASPWVADAAISRTLPNTLRVDVREREPLALAEMDRLYLMDAEGTLIEVYGPRTASFDLPIVRGLLGAGPAERRARAFRAGALLDDLGDAADELSEVEVLASGDLRLVLRATGDVVLMGQPPYRAPLVTFLGLREELRRRCPTAEYFDLRFRGRIYAKQQIEPGGVWGGRIPPDSRPEPNSLRRGAEDISDLPRPVTQ